MTHKSGRLACCPPAPRMQPPQPRLRTSLLGGGDSGRIGALLGWGAVQPGPVMLAQADPGHASQAHCIHACLRPRRPPIQSGACTPQPCTCPQILGNNECFEPYTSNIYVRRVLSGEFTVVNQHLLMDLTRLGLWTPDLKNELVAANGSVQACCSLNRCIYTT